MNRISLLSLLFLITSAAGCGGSGIDKKPTYPVAGSITVDGKTPDSAIQIECHPMDGFDNEKPSVSRTESDPEGKFTNVFIGYGNENDNSVLEFTYNWGVDKYELGKGFGHIAVEVDDVYAACAEAKRQGAKVVREAGPMNAGATIVAFITDPDGYYIEMIGKRDR